MAHVNPTVTSAATDSVTPPPHRSVAVTADKLGKGTWLAQETVTFAGQVMEGGVLSKTVIVCMQVFELPHASTAV